jgi:hypothetical protein
MMMNSHVLKKRVFKSQWIADSAAQGELLRLGSYLLLDEDESEFLQTHAYPPALSPDMIWAKKPTPPATTVKRPATAPPPLKPTPMKQLKVSPERRTTSGTPPPPEVRPQRYKVTDLFLDAAPVFAFVNLDNGYVPSILE